MVEQNETSTMYVSEKNQNIDLRTTTTQQSTPMDVDIGEPRSEESKSRRRR